MTHRQPTPGSIAIAEAKIKEEARGGACEGGGELPPAKAGGF
jgi:hypothetical protein